jgi:hypothetical protein
MSSRAPPAYGSKRRLCRFPTPDGQRFDPSQSRGTGRGPRVDYEILHDLKAEVTSRLESERVEVKREVELVVDGFRYVRHTDATGGLPCELHRREWGVVATDRQQLRHLQPNELLHSQLHNHVLRRLVRRDRNTSASDRRCSC